jgi:hypothetical protein
VLLCSWLILPFGLAAQSASSATQSSSRSTAKPAVHAKSPGLDAGSLTDGVYRNAGFGFTCKVPFGWVDRTTEMRADDTNVDAAADPERQQTLLGVFEHPPEATSDTINSAIVIAAESASAYPGLKDAAQYFGLLSDVIKAQGFKVVEEPYPSTVGAKQLVRGDFSREMGKLTMFQSSLVMLSKGYAVSFTFIGSSQEEVDNLIANLSFGGTKTAAK